MQKQFIDIGSPVQFATHVSTALVEYSAAGYNQASSTVLQDGDWFYDSGWANVVYRVKDQNTGQLLEEGVDYEIITGTPSASQNTFHLLTPQTGSEFAFYMIEPRTDTLPSTLEDTFTVAVAMALRKLLTLDVMLFMPVVFFRDKYIPSASLRQQMNLNDIALIKFDFIFLQHN